MAEYHDSDKAYRAKRLRYKRAALELIQRDRIEDELYSIMEECSSLEWSIEDDKTLLDALGGDSEDVREFRLMFSDLSNNCERLSDAIRDNYITEHFDDFFVGTIGNTYSLVGFDMMEEDYFSLVRYEAGCAQEVSHKRLMRLAKERIIAVAGQCIGIMMSFLDVRHQYDCLKASFDLLKDDRVALLKDVQTIGDAYEKLMENPNDYERRARYDDLLICLPDRVWTE